MNRLSFLFASTAIASTAWPAAAISQTLPNRRLSGMIISINGNALVLEKRNGTLVTVDLTEAAQNSHVGVIALREAVVLHGRYLADGTFHCMSTSHAGPKLQDWAADQ